MSIFGLYRVLAGTYKLKLATITQPFQGSYATLEEKSIEIRRLSKSLVGALRVPFMKRGAAEVLSVNQYLPFQTSSPSSKVSFKGALIDMISLKQHGL